MEKVQPRLVFSAAGMMLLGSAWLLPSHAAAASNPTPISIRSLMAGRADNNTDDMENSKVREKSGIGIVTFITSIAVALIVFGVQISVFALLRNKLARILYVLYRNPWTL